MAHTIENLPENKVKFTITIPAELVRRGMEHAAEHIAGAGDIPGFRPGKADYETVERYVGEMKLLEAATEELIRSSFVSAMIDEDLETVGQPYFSVVKLAPGNDFIYTAEVMRMPSVKKIADYAKLAVKPESTTPSDTMIATAKKDLVRMQTREIKAPVGHAIVSGDKAVVDLGMKKSGVPVDGGDAKNHAVYTGEPHYIPGFVDNIVGMKEGEEKSFTLPFPKDHYQKHLSGSDVEFNVKINDVFFLEPPVLDDAFAKSVGLASAQELEQKLVENLAAEKTLEESRRQDKAVLDLLAEKSDFDAIPDLLVNEEIEKMIAELTYQIEQNNMDFTAYLASIKKSLPELKLDFTPSAMTRIKVALLLREIAKKENIAVSEKEADKELDAIAAEYPEDSENRKRVFEPAYRDYVERQMTNRKTIDFLKGKMVR